MNEKDKKKRRNKLLNLYEMTPEDEAKLKEAEAAKKKEAESKDDAIKEIPSLDKPSVGGLAGLGSGLSTGGLSALKKPAGGKLGKLEPLNAPAPKRSAPPP